jgi:lipoate-protein ligase B
MARDGQLDCIDLGRIGYGPALELQRTLLERRLSGLIPDTLLLLEHDPVITIGTAGGEENVLVDEDRLRQAGIQVHRTDRGGNITYHGPGQLVGYPIFDLREHGKDVHGFLRQLEQSVIGVLAHYGIRGEAVPKLTGVWVGGDKVCSIGVAVRRWITYHGFALNVSPDFAHWSFIHPCGLVGKEVTSIERILGVPVDTAEVKALAAEKVAEVFGLTREWKEGAMSKD